MLLSLMRCEQLTVRAAYSLVSNYFLLFFFVMLLVEYFNIWNIN